MSGRDLADWDWDSLDEEPQFEQITRRERAVLPVSAGRKADRMSKKTFGSERAKKEVSRKVGGMHRRRQKTIR